MVDPYSNVGGWPLTFVVHRRRARIEQTEYGDPWYEPLFVRRKLHLWVDMKTETCYLAGVTAELGSKLQLVKIMKKHNAWSQNQRVRLRSWHFLKAYPSLW